MDTEFVDQKKRDFLVKATGAAGAIGISAMAVPFVTSMLPSVDVQAAGAPVRVDLSKMEIGEQKTIEWRGRPVWIIRRTEAALKRLAEKEDELRDPSSKIAQPPEYARNR